MSGTRVGSFFFNLDIDTGTLLIRAIDMKTSV